MSFDREGYSRLVLLKGRQIYFLSGSVRIHNDEPQIAKPVSTIWSDIPTNNLKGEGGVDFPGGKKPEMLVERVIRMISDDCEDIILDSFLGSGTTSAVAHKLRRRWIGIEMGEQAISHCVPRLASVVEGEQSGISGSVDWQGGGGFTFYRLGEEVFDDDGRIKSDIRFATLAAHVWFSETGSPMSRGLSESSLPQTGKDISPFLGVHGSKGYALLYNGVLGDKRPNGGNVLTNATLTHIRECGGGFDGPLIIYGEASRLSAARLKAEAITFKQTPYDVKAR